MQQGRLVHAAINEGQRATVTRIEVLKRGDPRLRNVETRYTLEEDGSTTIDFSTRISSETEPGVPKDCIACTSTRPELPLTERWDHNIPVLKVYLAGILSAARDIWDEANSEWGDKSLISRIVNNPRTDPRIVYALEQRALGNSWAQIRSQLAWSPAPSPLALAAESR